MTPDTDEFKKSQLLKLHAVKAEGESVEQNTFSFEELWSKRNDVQEFLIDDLIPKNAVAILLGEDGIGKTQLATQLCLAISFKFTTFLDLPLKATHHSALICATEDSRQKFTGAMIKQAMALYPKVDPKDVSLRFTEASNFDTLDELVAEIRRCIKIKTPDLIVIDAMSDLFTMIDGEINQNSHARRILKPIQQICNDCQTTIILIHHAAKTKIGPKQAAGKIFLDKFDSQGAGAITQKPRTILALANDPQTVTEDVKYYTNYLHVVKANLMGKTYMRSAIKLEFSEETLLHHYKQLQNIETWNTDNLVVVEDTKVKTDSGRTRVAKPTELPHDIHFQFIEFAFKVPHKTYTREEILYEMAGFYKVGTNKLSGKDGYLYHLVHVAKLMETEAGTYWKGGDTPF